MSILTGISAIALSFSSLLLVLGVPVFYMTQVSPEDNRSKKIRKIEALSVLCFIGFIEWFRRSNCSGFYWLN